MLTFSAKSSENNTFTITLAGRVKNAEHLTVNPETRLSEAISKAGGIDDFGVQYRFYRVRIINLNLTEREIVQNPPQNQQSIEEIKILKDSDPTMSELKLINGDILVFDRKHVYGK